MSLAESDQQLCQLLTTQFNQSGVRLQSQAYADLLRRSSWQQFWTLTFRPTKSGSNGSMHPEAA
ncbi:hypothetical protein FG476_00915, partial [Xylella fastidiosa subsp. multiplex]|nr:hypothetical protein [Xylella fastidiosa subsp. multiplex]MRU22708.1 hypothetical protein [Xylella fastidiosa subsp. multiplex]MRU25110.1 hypothetical protein [Xylella fastidiosa subsp. multiplex]MRU25119.1 hypothetical protein [Xylella fastidiosa subsp. multiplex]